MPDKFTRAAEKLLPKKLYDPRKTCQPDYPDEHKQGEVRGYNQAIDDCTPIVADLLRQVAELKEDNLALATRRLRVVEEKFEDKK